MDVTVTTTLITVGGGIATVAGSLWVARLTQRQAARATEAEAEAKADTTRVERERVQADREKASDAAILVAKEVYGDMVDDLRQQVIDLTATVTNLRREMEETRLADRAEISSLRSRVEELERGDRRLRDYVHLLIRRWPSRTVPVPAPPEGLILDA